MARYIFFILLIAVSGYEVSAQGNLARGFREGTIRENRVNRRVEGAPRVGKKLVAARDRFISQQLNMTDDESRRFWPVYRQYQQELTAIRILKRLNNSDAAANGAEQVNKDLDYENQQLNIRKHYRDEFMKILPPDKVSQLYKSEREFTDELIKQLSERSVRAGN